jgi:hypothetical protein
MLQLGEGFRSALGVQHELGQRQFRRRRRGGCLFRRRLAVQPLGQRRVAAGRRQPSRQEAQLRATLGGGQVARDRFQPGDGARGVALLQPEQRLAQRREGVGLDRLQQREKYRSAGRVGAVSGIWTGLAK